jgi:hypothetical protein
MPIPTQEAIGDCTKCKKPIQSGDGVTVDADGYLWHPGCRDAPKRSNVTIVRNRIRGRETGEGA